MAKCNYGERGLELNEGVQFPHAFSGRRGKFKDSVEGVMKSVGSIVFHGSVVQRVPCAWVPLWGLFSFDFELSGGATNAAVVAGFS